MRTSLERVIEGALAVGVVASGLLLLGGLALDAPAALRLGVVLLMLTPVVRVFIVTVGLLWARDFTFGLVSLWVLGILLAGVGVAVQHGLFDPPARP